MKHKYFSIAIIFFFSLLSAADIIREFKNETTAHLALEILLTSFAFLWFFYLWYRWIQATKKLSSSQTKIKTLNEENLRWKEENERLIAGLSQSIDEQLNRWMLTPAEKEVALLLLKGFSLKEISQLRGTSDKTIRQQATFIYQKSSLPGRAELSAFFLEDLLGPKI